MRIGVPREIKTLEGRVALVPAAVAQLVTEGHSVLVEQGAGLQSGYNDARYHAAGAELVADPTFIVDGVIHFGVTNMPGAVPHSASQALSAALMPYVSRLAASDWRADAELRRGINVDAGEIVHPALQELVT